jgi:two-component system OmpR family response regulator
MRVLIVEDDPTLAEILEQGLEEEGYAVDLSLDGEDGLWRATTVEYDAVVLDVMLPRVNGLDILRRMREERMASPVLLLTARDAVEDRVKGLDAGADDYLVKPFEWTELLARVRALIRRGGNGTPPVLTYADVELDPAAHVSRRSGRHLDLTPKEFQLLHLLLRSPERVVSRTEIIDHIYDDDFDGFSNVIDVFVSRLRRKLEEHGGTPLIRTVRGVGYVLREDRDA